MKNKTIFLIMCLLLFNGCATQDYFMAGGVKYYSKDEALNKTDQIISNDIAGIVPINNPINATALVAISTMQRIEDTMIEYKPNKESTKRVQIDYAREYWFKQFKLHYEVIIKRNLFTKVDLIADDYPENIITNSYDYIIYFYNPNPNAGQWFIKGKSLSEPKFVGADMSRPSGSPRLTSWLEVIEKTVRENQTSK